MTSFWHDAILFASQIMIILKNYTFVKSAEKPLTSQILCVISSKTAYVVVPLASTAIEIQQ